MQRCSKEARVLFLFFLVYRRELVNSLKRLLRRCWFIIRNEGRCSLHGKKRIGGKMVTRFITVYNIANESTSRYCMRDNLILITEVDSCLGNFDTVQIRTAYTVQSRWVDGKPV